jgi:hypothetical protein
MFLPLEKGESRPRRASPIGRSINRRRQGVIYATFLCKAQRPQGFKTKILAAGRYQAVRSYLTAGGAGLPNFCGSIAAFG